MAQPIPACLAASWQDFLDHLGGAGPVGATRLGADRARAASNGNTQINGLRVIPPRHRPLETALSYQAGRDLSTRTKRCAQVSIWCYASARGVWGFPDTGRLSNPDL
jgi:hypothetical protein